MSGRPKRGTTDELWRDLAGRPPPLNSPMKKIDKAAYQERLDRITAIFKDMMAHATEQATYRCPYKNRFDECTARFGCRNQRKPREAGGLLVCGGDDKLDYRRAW